MTIYLRFPDEPTFLTLAPTDEDGNITLPNIDIIGTIYTAGEYDDEGDIITPPEPTPGYHVNMLGEVPPEFQPYVIPEPENPYRVFARPKMIEVYLWDDQRIFTHSETLDPSGPMPWAYTRTPPPETQGDEVAQWANGKWIVLPERPARPVVWPQFTALQMLDLFTEEEQIAVVSATMTVPAVKLWYDRLIAATFVTYEDPRTEGGLQALVDAGLLAPGRKADIVAAMQPVMS